jgi:hypothetical protein
VTKPRDLKAVFGAADRRLLVGGNQAPIVVRDAYKRVLSPGDIVILIDGMVPQFVVVDIVPAVEPHAPPGLVKVVLQAALTIGTLRNNAMSNMVRVRTAAERGLINGQRATEEDLALPIVDHEPREGAREEPPGALVPTDPPPDE